MLLLCEGGTEIPIHQRAEADQTDFSFQVQLGYSAGLLGLLRG